MSYSPPPAPHPGSDNRYTASQEQVPAKPLAEEPAEPVPLQGVSDSPEHHKEERSEAYQTEPVAMPPAPELSSSSINTDVRRHGLNPFLTGVTVAIIACILAFLICFVYLVVFYLRYPDG